MSTYQAKDSTTQGVQLKVQELHLPFTIVGSATAASVSIVVADPAVLFLNTEGVNQITAALAAADTAPDPAASARRSPVAALPASPAIPPASPCGSAALRAIPPAGQVSFL